MKLNINVIFHYFTFADLWRTKTLQLRDHLCLVLSKVSCKLTTSSCTLTICFAVDLHQFYQKVMEHGGYDGCVSKKSWKSVYDELGGNPQNTSAATCTRRHYEK